MEPLYYRHFETQNFLATFCYNIETNFENSLSTAELMNMLCKMNIHTHNTPITSYSGKPNMLKVSPNNNLVRHLPPRNKILKVDDLDVRNLMVTHPLSKLFKGIFHVKHTQQLLHC